MSFGINHLRKSSRDSLPSIVITCIGLLIILVVDSSYGGLTCAPIIGLCTLFLLAIKYPPRVVVFCLVPLSLFVAFRLWDSGGGPFHTGVETARFWIRTFTFFTGGMLAVAASGYRSRLDRVRFQVVTLLEAVPIPLIIADASGRIWAASSRACEVSGFSRENLVGFRFPDIVGYHLLEEAAEDWYQHWMRSPEEKIFDVELQLGTHRSNAKVGRIGSGRHAMMIVIFL